MTLERPDFQRLLFRTAFCVMACNGELHQKEKDEIRGMSKSASYFKGINLSAELQELLNDFKERGTHIVEELFETLTKLDASIVQELLLLEVAFRVVAADNEEDEYERKFVRFLRSKLKVHDEVIRDRFGAVDYLFDRDYTQDIVKSETHNDLFASIAIPEFKDLVTVDFSNFNENREDINN